jgi:uncharacterized SAM-binding protein YcdF (DUF218 family)
LPRRPRKFRRIVAVALAGLIGLGAIFAARRLPTFLICESQPKRADLILILGGDFYGPRVLKGAELAKDGFAPKAAISGPPYQGRPQGDVAIDFLVSRGYQRELFTVFANSAQSTIEEAVAVCPELKQRRARRVLLVTSKFHSRRSAIVFSLFCPSVQFISVPADDAHYDPQRWRTDPSSKKIFVDEWTKIIGTMFYAYPAYCLKRILDSPGNFSSHKEVANFEPVHRPFLSHRPT